MDRPQVAGSKSACGPFRHLENAARTGPVAGRPNAMARSTEQFAFIGKTSHRPATGPRKSSVDRVPVARPGPTIDLERRTAVGRKFLEWAEGQEISELGPGRCSSEI